MVKNIFVLFYILVILIVFGECGYQNSRYNKNGYRQNSNNVQTSGGSRVRAARSCSPPRLANGFVTPLFKGKMMRFDCNKGYSRKGERYAECLSGRWSIYVFPICIKAGCPLISAPDNGKITYLNEKAMVMLFCEPNYETVGSIYAHCNGTHWDRVIGSCRETDNTPATSCDFETENICGWTHDTDHDFDFERRSGYNNKTISMATGPQADHTIGVPFQGHYMVINTNTEVYVKRARLISPLYRITAQTLCFKFYYHMYGVNIGTLRVYMKPESVESEAKNDFIVFEIKGSQKNQWIEGGGFMKPVNESFQIIIEAISGQTRLSDIAFDDVEILTDGECSDDEDDTKVQETKDDDNAVLSVDSCVNRCHEEKNTTVEVTNHTLTCSCSRYCDVNFSCCPDYIEVCSVELQNATSSSQPTISSSTLKMTETDSTSKTTTTIRSSTLSTNLPTTIKFSTTTTLSTTPSTTSTIKKTSTTTTKATTTTNPTTTSKPSTTSSTTISTNPITSTQKLIVNPQMPQRGSTFNQTEQMATNNVDDYDEVVNNNIEDEHEVERDDEVEMTQATLVVNHNSDNIINERLMMDTKSDKIDNSLIINVTLLASATVVISIVAFMFGLRQYKKSTNPLNYKEKQENGSTKANEEFSEIRFLTSDETLDFSLATPDSATEL